MWKVKRQLNLDYQIVSKSKNSLASPANCVDETSTKTIRAMKIGKIHDGKWCEMSNLHVCDYSFLLFWDIIN